MPKENRSLLRAFDVQSRMFIPLWRRVAIVGVCGLWAILEWWSGNPGWALLFAAIGAYCAHQFFIAFNPPEDEGGS
ncbi:hypothetical protein [Boseongicola aestuarii]|jgi:hypothetical protein|uniref:DUF3329 domain-containing protein n=1 Tax=Boseongicola aestuarii TaxID=1470561 RepID=A0A238J0K7_9RHOB|nr:hypothetical protein [Boseongicola aestuarii]SMX23853.1 hypothetical protein BOA8489_01966 [Boseongicola aestuarii]